MSSNQEELSSSSSTSVDPKQTSTTMESETVSNIETIKTDSDSESKASSDTPKKKRRRAENERLMEDLSGIDKSMAATTIENSPTTPATRSLRTRNQARSSDIPSTSTSSSSSATSNETKKTIDNEDLIQKQLKEKEKEKERQKRRIESLRIRLERAVVTNRDMGVTFLFLSPNDMAANFLYSDNYVALKIIDFKPIRFVELPKDANDNKMHYKSPLLEVTCQDFNDRFEIEHIHGVFDDPSIKCASSSIITVYLLGTHALKSKNLINKNLLLHISRVWTCHNKTDFFRIMQKRKTATTTSSETELNNGNNGEYPFSIIVHFNEDLELNFKISPDSKKDDNDNQDEELLQYDPFIDIYQHSLKTITEVKIDGDDDLDFTGLDLFDLPEISFNSNWKAPRDIKYINRDLYKRQDSIAYSESTSKTIKPN